MSKIVISKGGRLKMLIYQNNLVLLKNKYCYLEIMGV